MKSMDSARRDLIRAESMRRAATFEVRGSNCYSFLPHAQGKRRRSAEGAEGTNKGHENSEGMAIGCVRVDLAVRRRALPAPHEN